jgi:hypothetical protein
MNENGEQKPILQDTDIQLSSEELEGVFSVIKTLKSMDQFGISITVDTPKMGRPIAITREVLAELSKAWVVGCNDEEACTFAGVYPATLYRFQKQYPEFLEYKEHLKRNPVLKARFALYKALDDPNFAWKFLQKKTTDLRDDDRPNVQLNVQLNQLVEEDRKRVDG